MTLDTLRSHDPADMYSAIRNFAAYAREGVELGRNAPPLSRAKARSILITGLGGSAIGGDLLRSYVQGFHDHGGVSIQVYRGYQPPAVDSKTTVVASSYSGNTEETLASYEALRGNAGQMLVMTTGGTLGGWADANRHRKVVLPGGLQPRAALAYSFFPLLYLLAVKSELFGAGVRQETERGIEETIPMLEKLAKKYGAGPASSNTAFSLAEKINGSIPVVYSASDRLDTVNVRWRGQIQENAKYLAFGNLLPEMNHNEINGWGHPADLAGRFITIYLRDRDDHPRVAARIDITKKIIGRSAGNVLEVRSQGETLLARLFSLICLGDWVSYYLATLNGTDPSPVPVIENLKKQLARRA
ncbi:MAG: bifunctional phosphoglucose/phosphomannose isomerase [Bacteroidetes bacterium]|nr:bifunctional phosphoglucose/phosphomannose isomerase [Bacteroidota bacterium]